jgi:hypothetical protein
MDFIIDAQTHEGRVEALAARGSTKALSLVKRTAAGESPVDASLTDENRAQAKDVLAYIDSLKP